MDNRLFFVGNSSLKFDKTITRKKMFEELPLIYREHGSATRNAMEEFIKKNRVDLK